VDTRESGGGEERERFKGGMIDSSCFLGKK